MKKLYCLFTVLACAVAAMAQTPEEILSRMETEMDKHEQEGLVMTVDTKIPILGTMSIKTYALGDKLRMESEMMGVRIVTWTDGETEWTYESKSNKIEIKYADASTTEDSGDAEMFNGIADGYDVTIAKETADAWHLLCKKSRANQDKDAPKRMDLVVAKGTYLPISLKAKVSGVTMTIRDLSFGVTVDQVTFDINKYPEATVEDKRESL